MDPMARFDSPDEVNGILNTFAARGYHQLDTARMYSPHAPGSSEPRLGAVAAGDRFAIDTKVVSRDPGDHSKSKVLEEIDISLDALKVKQINIEYLHVPDRATRFEEACEAMDQAHKEGKIKHWGLSNYTAQEVQQFLDICEEHGYVKPSVYQGQYNAIVRGGEKELFPVLRKNGIAFYVFSPAAAGFFAGNAKKVKAGGRYDTSVRTTLFLFTVQFLAIMLLSANRLAHSIKLAACIRVSTKSRPSWPRRTTRHPWRLSTELVGTLPHFDGRRTTVFWKRRTETPSSWVPPARSSWIQTSTRSSKDRSLRMWWPLLTPCMGRLTRRARLRITCKSRVHRGKGLRGLGGQGDVRSR